MTIHRATALAVLLTCTALGAAPAQDTSLVGLWYAKRYFGPEVRGDLIVQRTGGRWQSASPSSSRSRFFRRSTGSPIPSC